MTAWERWLKQKLIELRPECLCPLDGEADRLAAAALPLAQRCVPGVPTTVPCTLALGIDALTGLDVASAHRLIQHTRLYVAPRLFLLAHANCALDDDAFRALGFLCELFDTETGSRIHTYDLPRYKPTPDWLNARYWANPERWEP